MGNRDVQFSPSQITRIKTVCAGLQTSMADFIVFATMQAVDEVEGLTRDQEEIRRWYAGPRR